MFFGAIEYIKISKFQNIQQLICVLIHFGGTTLANQSIQRQEIPEDLVGTIMFLASEASAFVTGQTILVNGGLTFR